MDVVQPLGAILFVMALLGGALVLLKRRGRASFGASFGAAMGVGRSVRRLEVVERVSLGPQHALHLVRAGGKLMLVATAPNSCQLLGGTFAGEETP
jgi:flagellar biogenesis protein FliO